MEASTVTPRRVVIPPVGHGTGAGPSGERLLRNVAAPVVGALREAGDMGAFALRAVLEVRGVWRHSAEILRPAGILTVGSAPMIWCLECTIDIECGFDANSVRRR